MGTFTGRSITIAIMRKQSKRITTDCRAGVCVS
jgi:hypothetical protein